MRCKRVPWVESQQVFAGRKQRWKKIGCHEVYRLASDFAFAFAVGVSWTIGASHEVRISKSRARIHLRPSLVGVPSADQSESGIGEQPADSRSRRRPRAHLAKLQRG